MKYYLTLLLRGFRHPGKVARGITAFFRNRATEVFIISYPKSGRTWLRVLVNRSLQHKAKVADSHLLRTFEISRKSRCLTTQFSHDGLCNLYNYDPYNRLSYKSHLYEGRKVVFLKRDIRDVLVSHYFEETRRMKTFTGSLSDFIRHDVFGARKLVEFNNMWFRNRKIPSDFLLISYEELHHSPHQVLKQVLEFMGAPDATDTVLEEAIEYSSFENLRKRELNNEFKSSRLSPGDPGDANSFKTRKGKIGGFREAMNPEDILFIEETVRSHGDPGCDWYFHPEAS